MAEHPLKEQFFSHFGIEPRITSCTQYSVCVCVGGGGGVSVKGQCLSEVSMYLLLF